ncbi:MAG: DUF368 domain-containing protein [Bacilli bacterium]
MENKKNNVNNQPHNWKSKFIDFLKGGAIGAACLIPGVSGGTIAVLFKIYQKIIFAVNDLFKHFWKSVSVLLPIVLGILVAIIALTNPIKSAFESIPFPLICLFTGLIIGGMPELFPFIKKKITLSGGMAFALSCLLIIGLCFVPNMSNVDVSSITVSSFIFIFAMGILAASALVVPGISGSMMMLVFGFYYPLLMVVSDLMKFGTNFNLDLIILLIFLLGVIVGFFLISKLMGYLLKKYEYQTYMGIVGFIVGSIFALFYQFSPNAILSLPLFTSAMPKWGHITLAVILFLLGLFGSLAVIYYSRKKLKESEKKAKKENEIR